MEPRATGRLIWVSLGGRIYTGGASVDPVVEGSGGACIASQSSSWRAPFKASSNSASSPSL